MSYATVNGKGYGYWSESESHVYDDVPALYQTEHYELRIVFDGAHKLDDYGVVNKQTGIIENFTNNIGRGKWLVDQATELATKGYQDPTEGLIEALGRLRGELPDLGGDDDSEPFPGRGRKSN